MIDQSLVVDDLLFATHRDRALYIGRSVRDRPQWLRDNAGKWRRIQDVRQEAPPLRLVVESEIDVGVVSAGPSSHTSSRDRRNDGNDDDAAQLADIPAGDCSPPNEPVPAMAPRVIDPPPPVSLAAGGIEIGARRYVGAERLASMLGVSIRTLSRWGASGTGPLKIKIGKKVFFDLGKIPEWLASQEIPSTRIPRKQ